MVHGQDLSLSVYVSRMSQVYILLQQYTPSLVIVTAVVTGSGATQHAGEDYTLTCTVSGGENTSATIDTYQWLRDSSPLPGETSATLSFTPLRQTTPSSNGQYVCETMRSGRTVRSDNVTVAVTGKLECGKACPWH